MSREPSSSSHRLSQSSGGWTPPKTDPPPPPKPPKPKKYRVRVEPAKPDLRNYPTPRLGKPRSQTVHHVQVDEGEEKLLKVLREVAPGTAGEAADRVRAQHQREQQLNRRWQEMTAEERNTY